MVKIKFATGNAAFENFQEEIARVLRELASSIETNVDCDEQDQEISIRDINGNTIGSAVINH